jgi:hypothetical protein
VCGCHPAAGAQRLIRPLTSAAAAFARSSAAIVSRGGGGQLVQMAPEGRLVCRAQHSNTHVGSRLLTLHRG